MRWSMMSPPIGEKFSHLLIADWRGIEIGHVEPNPKKNLEDDPEENLGDDLEVDPVIDIEDNPEEDPNEKW
ncbi:hypothetical protein ACH5RR_033970 [Cinchona calisaya]|uniref:Uncharacterized protein n=1 Tax=Cinchona calisaya TaxID=153742 RepID=A0ABD2YDC4_9GENT